MIKYIIIVIVLGFISNLYSKEIVHKVSKGEFLYQIAYKYLSQTEYLYVDDFINKIKKDNNIKKYVKPNQKLKITVLDKSLTTTRIKKPEKVKALYYTVSNVAYKDFVKRVKTYKKVGINSVVIDIKNMIGEVTIPFNNELKKEIKTVHWSSVGQLNKLLYYLHKEDIYVIARVVCFHDQIMAKNKKEYRVFKNNRNWVNPANKDVQNYLLSLIDTLLKYPIDELQLDYVRFPASGSKKCTSYKSDAIISFLKRVHKRTKKAGIKLGLDVFGIALWQRKTDECAIGQNLRKMADHADVISPMVYPSHFSSPFDGVKDPSNSPGLIIKKSTERERIVFKDKDIEIRPYLQAFAWKTKKYDKDYILEQIDNLGDNGYIFWNARGKYQAIYNALNYKNLKKKKKELKEGKQKIDNIIDNIEE
jgi:hypothetical protein